MASDERRVSEAMRNSMPANAAVWALQLALAIYLAVFSALPMLRGDAYITETFDRIGFGDWFRHTTGIIELAGAVGLLIPILCGLAAMGLVGVMIGAIITEFSVRSPSGAIVPAVLLLLFAFVAWYRWPQTRAFADRVRS